MADDLPARNPHPPEPAAKLPAPPKPRVPAPDAGHIPITEEMDKAKWTLPPLSIVGIGLVVALIAVAAFFYLNRAQPVGAGVITDVFAVESGSSVIVAVQFHFSNSTEKPLFVRSIQATVNAGGKDLTDDHALSAVDYPRYFKAYPDMAAHAPNPIMPETRLAPGQQVAGSAIFSFDTDKASFGARKPLVLTIVPYDRKNITLTENRGAAQP